MVVLEHMEPRYHYTYCNIQQCNDIVCGDLLNVVTTYYGAQSHFAPCPRQSCTDARRAGAPGA